MKVTNERRHVMTETIIVAGISLFGTLAGTFGGILTSNKLTRKSKNPDGMRVKC